MRFLSHFLPGFISSSGPPRPVCTPIPPAFSFRRLRLLSYPTVGLVWGRLSSPGTPSSSRPFPWLGLYPWAFSGAPQSTHLSLLGHLAFSARCVWAASPHRLCDLSGSRHVPSTRLPEPSGPFLHNGAPVPSQDSPLVASSVSASQNRGRLMAQDSPWFWMHLSVPPRWDWPRKSLYPLSDP